MDKHITEELNLLFQPRIDLKQKALHSIEIFLVWENPNKGTIPASDFISEAEKKGLSTTIDDWYIIETCKHLKKWMQGGKNNLLVSLNLSKDTLKQTNFLEKFSDTIQSYDLAPDNFELLFTEELLEKIDNPIEFLHQCNRLGFHILLKNNAKPPTAFSYVKHYPYDAVKINPNKIFLGENNQKITSLIRGIAENLNLEIIFDPIDKKSDKEKLDPMGVGKGQGNYICPALTSKDFNQWLKENVGPEIPS